VLTGVRWRSTLSTRKPKAWIEDGGCDFLCYVGVGGRIEGVRTMVHQWSMKMEARAFCSRMPSEIAIDMAMSEAEMEYWSGKGAHVKRSVIRG